MKVKKDQLLKALEIVRPGLANKEIIEQATSFAFMDGVLATYNDEISLRHPIPELADIRGAIQADNLYKFLGKIKGDADGNIELSLNENNEIVVKSGRSKAGLSLQADITLPLDDKDFSKKGDWYDLPEDFIKFLKMTAGSCGKDMSMPVLTCVHVNRDGIIEGADNYRFIKCDLKDEFPFESFLLPATSVMEVVKLNPTQIAEGEGWIHFMNEEETIISCRVVEDKYPDTKPVYKIKGIRLILPKSTNEVLERAMIFSKRDHALDEDVDVSIQNKTLIIEAKSDSGWFKEDINMNYSGDPIHFNITPYLLRSILAETLECELGENKLGFQGEGWEYISLLRG